MNVFLENVGDSIDSAIVLDYEEGLIMNDLMKYC